MTCRRTDIIFLWGMPGVGKTTVGKALAGSCGKQFLDLDDRIASDTGKSIPEIFASEGESAFRRYEEDILQKVVEQEANLIVSCGGGTPCRPSVHALMQRSGICVYLKGTIPLLMHRLLGELSHRPLLSHKPNEEVRAWLSEQIVKRSPWYEQAHIVYPVLDCPLRDTSHKLCLRIEQLIAEGV